MLFIRACKVEDPEKRLLSVYRRFYGDYSNPKSHIGKILCRICEQLNLVTITKVMEGLAPTWFPIPGGEPPYEEKVFNYFTSVLRLTSVFEGLPKEFIPTARWRKRYENQ